MMTALANRNVSRQEPINRSDLRSWAEWHTPWMKEVPRQALGAGASPVPPKAALTSFQLPLGPCTNKVQSLQSNSLPRRKLITQQNFLTTPWRQGSCFSFPEPYPPGLPWCLQDLFNGLFFSISFVNSQPTTDFWGLSNPHGSQPFGCVLTLVTALSKVLLSF